MLPYAFACCHARQAACPCASDHRKPRCCPALQTSTPCRRSDAPGQAAPAQPPAVRSGAAAAAPPVCGHPAAGWVRPGNQGEQQELLTCLKKRVGRQKLSLAPVLQGRVVCGGVELLVCSAGRHTQVGCPATCKHGVQSARKPAMHLLPALAFLHLMHSTYFDRCRATASDTTSRATACWTAC